MHFLVIALGTDGDVLPLMSLGNHLKKRDHRVTFLAPAVYARMAEEGGMDFLPLSGQTEYEHSVRDISLLNTRYRVVFLLRHALNWNRLVYRAVKSLSAPDLVVMAVDRAMLWADYSVHFHLRIPVIRIELEPPHLRNVPGEPRELPESGVQRALMDKLETGWREVMENFGVTLGPHSMARLRRSSFRVIPRIRLYPGWLTGGRQSHPERNFGFVAATGHLPESLVVPVDVSSKRKLVIFVAGTLGTTRLWSHWFFGISEEICRKLDCNGLFLGGEAYAPSEAPVSSITWKSFVPLAQILPHASAIVHHGGIGTAAAAIEHAVPQAIVPRFVWQFSNAEWLRKLGVCVVLQEKDFTVKRGTEELQRLSNDDRYRDRSFQLAQQSNPIDLPSRICKFLETWGKSQSNRSQRQSLGRGAIGA